MEKVINITDIQNGKQALLCLCFVYLSISQVSLFRTTADFWKSQLDELI